MRTACRCALLVLFLPCAFASAARSAQWIVAQDGSGAFRSIQGAIDASSYGDIVYVSAGVYDEHVVLKDGVRVVGAGASSTVVRHAYGFDEVVRIRNMGSGTLEQVTIERLASVLPGPAVYADSAAASLIDCTIQNGQSAGVEVTGTACTLTLKRVSITGNVGHGLYVHDGAQAVLQDSRIEENTGSGLVIGAASAVHVSGTTISDNGRCGIALEGDADLDMGSSTIRRQPEWGILALGAAHVRLLDVILADSGIGGLELAGTTDAVVTDAVVSGGGDGVVVAGSARLEATRLRVSDVVGDGLLLAEESTLEASQLEIVAASRDGVILSTAGDVSIAESTIIENGGDGLLVRAGRPRVRQTILAYNRGAGVRLDASQSPPPTADLAYNTVWDNGEDYVGTARPASDVAASPALLDLDGRFALLPDSPCIGAGPAWTSIGSGEDASALTTFSFDLAPELDGWLGATWTSTLRLGGFPVALETFGIGGHWVGDTGRLDLDASLLGAWGMRAAAHAEGAIRWDVPTPETGHATLAFGGDGRLDGARSWASAWVSGEVENSGLYGGGRFSLAWPNGPWTADLTLGLAGRIPIRLSAGIAALSLRSLLASLSTDFPLADGTLRMDGTVSLLPVWEAVSDVVWMRESEEWRARVAFRPAEDAFAFYAVVGDTTARLEAHARIVSGVPMDGDLSLMVGGPVLRVRAGLAIDATGARFSGGLELTLNGFFRKSPNEPPIPAFQSAPPDPEAGVPVHFLANESSDPDGEIREIWWDFGDGSAAEGATVDHIYATAGDYAVVLTVSDDDGATSSLTTPIRVWPPDTTPVGAFAAYPVTASGIRLPRPLRDGDLIRLDAGESSDRDGHIVEYAWDVGADGEFDVTSTEPFATVGPLAPGSHPITLRVIDDSGRSNAVMHVVAVNKSQPPHAQFSFAPPTPAVRDPVRFTDRSTDTDGEIVSRDWNFGDDATSREPSPTHRYQRVGKYTVALRVTDDAGLTATTEQAVAVSTMPDVVDVSDVWAVLIGISDYAEVKDLQYAAADAIAMARWLLDAGVEPDHIRLLLDREGPQDELGGLAARRATLVNVREALGWLRRMAKPDDLVLIHFSGHGFQGPDDDGDERDGVDEFFVLWDTLNAAKEDTALRDDEFGAALDRVESQHVVVLFDGCYSGGLSRSLPSTAHPIIGKQDLFSDFSVEGRLVFSASAESQEAFESDELQHGIFTYYLLDGLKGNADANNDGRITAWELYEYVAGAVPGRARLEHNAQQDPQLLGEGDVRVLLAQAAGPPSADFGYRPDTPYAGGAVSFVDQSTADRPLVEHHWTFGDGTASEEASPNHAYAEAGDYTVELRIAGRDGVESSVQHIVHVEAPGEVVSIDASSAVLVLSIGRDHGVAVGDQFEVVPEDASGSAPTRIEVTELMETRTSAGRLIEGELPAPGSRLRPVPAD